MVEFLLVVYGLITMGAYYHAAPLARSVLEIPICEWSYVHSMYMLAFALGWVFWWPLFLCGEYRRCLASKDKHNIKLTDVEKSIPMYATTMCLGLWVIFLFSLIGDTTCWLLIPTTFTCVTILWGLTKTMGPLSVSLDNAFGIAAISLLYPLAWLLAILFCYVTYKDLSEIEVKLDVACI